MVDPSIRAKRRDVGNRDRLRYGSGVVNDVAAAVTNNDQTVDVRIDGGGSVGPCSPAAGARTPVVPSRTAAPSVMLPVTHAPSRICEGMQSAATAEDAQVNARREPTDTDIDTAKSVAAGLATEVLTIPNLLS